MHLDRGQKKILKLTEGLSVVERDYIKVFISNLKSIFTTKADLLIIYIAAKRF